MAKAQAASTSAPRAPNPDLAALEKELSAGGAAPKGKGGKKKKAAATGTSWVVRWGRVLGYWRDQVREVLSGLGSPDRPTRRMAFLFLLSAVGLVGSTALTLRHVWKVARPPAATSTELGGNLGSFLSRQAEEARLKYTMQTLGTFTVELAPVPGRKAAPGVMNLAEVEVVVECDVKETCAYIDDRQPDARSQLVNVFTVLDREEVLSREGKRRLKKRLIDKLNLWLPKGKIENLYFSKLVLS
jgi:flagellar basal body-associated protein FliL